MNVDEIFISELLNDLENGDLQLPTLPEVALRVRDAVEDEESSADQIAAIIATDAALSARLLQVANSPLYRGQTPINDLNTVISRLGNKLVRNLVTSQVMKQMFQATSDYVDQRLRTVWEHSVQVAAISRVLAAQLTKLPPDEAMLAGLLHDIGALPVLYRAEERPDLLAQPELLDCVLNTLHPKIGSKILQQWHFPESLVKVAAEHENLDYQHSGPADLVDIVQVANLQAHGNTEHPLSKTDWQTVTAFERLGLADEIHEIELCRVEEEIDAVHDVLENA